MPMIASEENNDRKGSYVSEVGYTHGFYGGLDPLSLSCLAQLKGQAGRNVDETFTYFELGCGNGVTANILAVANPHARFYANDFNAGHCRNAIEFSKVGNVENLTILEKSFEQLLEMDLPQCDFIVLHGVYTWVSEEARACIVEFISRFLKSSGLVYVSYNCSPGRSGFEPVRQFMMQMTEELDGEIEDRIGGSLEFLQKASPRMPFFKTFTKELERVNEFASEDKRYVAHELFNKDWTLFFHKEVADEMSKAGLSYVATSEMVQNFPEYLMSGDLLEIYRSLEKTELAEMFSDLALGRSFRKDIFVKAEKPQESKIVSEQLDQLWVALAKPKNELKYVEKIPVGEVSFKRDRYEPIVEMLASEPMSLSVLQDRLNVSSNERSDFIDRVFRLIAFGYVSPSHSRDWVRTNGPKVKRFNQAIVGNSIDGVRHEILVSPFLGMGIKVSRTDQFFILARKRGVDPVDFALQRLTEEGAFIAKSGGDPLQSEEIHRESIESKYRKFMTIAYPYLEYLEVL